MINPRSDVETELAKAHTRISAALALLTPEARITFQSNQQHIAALIKALTA